MKKLVFAMFAMVAMSFMACGGQTDSTNVATDSDSVAVDSIEVVDSIVVDSTIAK